VVAAIVVVVAYELVAGILTTIYAPVWVGHDYRLYIDAAREWLASGTFYAPAQLAGPYQVVDSEVLYPPVALVLFVPFTILPAALWWAIPLGITLAVIASHRPGPWRVAAMLALLALPLEAGTSYSLSSIVNGNPVVWVVLFVALATRWPVFAPFAAVKFTLLPFAFVGVGSRAWLLGLALLALLSLPFGAMWIDYFMALGNATSEGPPILYSLRQIPLVAVPLLAAATWSWGNRPW